MSFGSSTLPLRPGANPLSQMQTFYGRASATFFTHCALLTVTDWILHLMIVNCCLQFFFYFIQLHCEPSISHIPFPFHGIEWSVTLSLYTGDKSIFDDEEGAPLDVGDLWVRSSSVLSLAQYMSFHHGSLFLYYTLDSCSTGTDGDE